MIVSRTIGPQTIVPEDNCLRGKMPPKTIAPRTIAPEENCRLTIKFFPKTVALTKAIPAQTVLPVN